MAGLPDLRQEWRILYSQTLPALARARDHVQSKWPVHLDHCFARIILDNTVGEGTQQWDKVISKPAVQHMDAAQLRKAIELGRKIETGQRDLCELDEISLLCRGKNTGKYAYKQDAAASSRKRKADDRGLIEHQKMAKAPSRQSTLSFSTRDQTNSKTPSDNPKNQSPTSRSDSAESLRRIRNHPTLTPYRKRLYTILLSVPPGRYTTYAAMSDYLHSSARAVGSGMRNNPFAPDVPCHRCLAADGSIGGFNGDWGQQGKYAPEKLKLLRNEGVRFDGKGKAVGEPFRNFHEFTP